MKYTIGKVAKALGITTQRVRHYEAMGIIDSKRNEQNQYRTYSSKDTKALFQSCLYRSMGFSLKEIKSMLTELNANDVSELFEQRIEEVDDKIESLMSLRHELVEYRKGLKYSAENLSNLEIIEGDFSFYIVLKNTAGGGIPGDEDDFLIRYEQYVPYIRSVSCIKTSTIFGDDKDVEFNYGVLMSVPAVQFFQKSDELKEQRIDLKKCYAKMNIEVSNSSGYAKNLRMFFEAIKQAGYQPSDTIYGVIRFTSLHERETDIYEYVTEVKKVQ